MEKITIFTPTYNRGYILSRLYISLKNQTCKDFVWIIVDDGSTDNTDELVTNWMRENKIKIKYHKQTNQGKSIAHNKGVKLTRTELFACVDSDDFLKETAIADIIHEWKNVVDENIIGILAYRGFPDGGAITSIGQHDFYSTTLQEAYEKKGLRGDTFLIYRTDIISRYKFPKFKEEKFVPEAYLYDLLDQEGKLLFFPKVLYYGDYLQDGYTRNMGKLLLNNYRGYLAYIVQRLELEKSLKGKITSTIKYTAMCIASKKHQYIINSVYPLITILTWPIAYIFYSKRYKPLK